MRVIVACEFSGKVRDAFIRLGHDAISCDLLPSESNLGPHIQGDILDVDLSVFDLLIAHPPCTYLCASGARWWAGRIREQREAIRFAVELWSAPVLKKAIENPIGILSKTVMRKPTQIIQPWMFGHPEVKATCLWLTNLPKLYATSYAQGIWKESIHRMPPSENRSKERSRTFQGIADAMAEQWGDHLDPRLHSDY